MFQFLKKKKHFFYILVILFLVNCYSCFKSNKKKTKCYTTYFCHLNGALNKNMMSSVDQYIGVLGIVLVWNIQAY